MIIQAHIDARMHAKHQECLAALLALSVCLDGFELLCLSLYTLIKVGPEHNNPILYKKKNWYFRRFFKHIKFKFITWIAHQQAFSTLKKKIRRSIGKKLKINK
jgi:hypothetical protein